MHEIDLKKEPEGQKVKAHTPGIKRSTPKDFGQSKMTVLICDEHDKVILSQRLWFD